MGSAADQASTRPLGVAIRIRKRTAMGFILVTKAPVCTVRTTTLSRGGVRLNRREPWALGAFVYIDLG